MKRKLTSYLIVFFLCVLASCEKDRLDPLPSSSSDYEANLTRADINGKVLELIEKGQDINWNAFSDSEIGSAFKLTDEKIVTFSWSLNSTDDYEKDVIINRFRDLEPDDDSNKLDQIVKINTDLNYVDLRINSVETLIELRNLPEVEFTDIYYSMLSKEEQISGLSKIETYYSELENNSTSQSKQQNTNFKTFSQDVGEYHNIAETWGHPLLANDGLGIKVAVIDVGLLPSDSDYGEGQFENVSQNNRVGAYKAFPWQQNTDGPYSLEGFPGIPGVFANHGVGRLREIGHRTANSQNQRGVARNTELVSIRASNSVALDLFTNIWANINGVGEAYENLATDSDIKIISMSMGSIWSYSKISNAVNLFNNKDIMLFNAAGSLPAAILLEPILFRTLGNFTVFPARMEQTIACTAVHFVGGVPVYAFQAFGNADLIAQFDFIGAPTTLNGGTSSEATTYNVGMAASIWSTNLSLSKYDVYDKMKAASDRPTNNIHAFGHGRVNMLKFIQNEQSNVRTVAIKGTNNKYVTRSTGIAAMQCNRPFVGSWERFIMITHGDGKVSFKGTNNKYVSSEYGNRTMRCNRSSIGSWEKFTVVQLSGGQVAFRGSNGKYVSRSAGFDRLKCNRSSIGSQEKFTIASL